MIRIEGFENVYHLNEQYEFSLKLKPKC